jgi:beta-lactamase regulating signal transducer with metallopeptidase domain
MIEFLHTASQTAAGAAISGTWQGLLLTAFVWICLKLLPGTTATLRYSVWAGAFAAATLLPVFGLVPASGAIDHLVGPSLHSQAGNSLIQLSPLWAFGIATLWLALSLLRGLGLTRNAFKLRALWKTAIPVAGHSALSTKGIRAAQLCTSIQVDQPCVIGFFAPRILIPAWLLEKASPLELEQIVLHETAHLRRMDDWMNLLQQVALILFPLSPALFWIEKRLCAEREGACDESVIRATRAPRDYAMCLANLAQQRIESRLDRRAVSLSLGAWEKQSELALRIHRILGRQKQLNPLTAGLVMGALLLATLGGAIELGRSAQLVSFAAVEPAPVMAKVREKRSTSPHLEDVVYREPARQMLSRIATTLPRVIPASHAPAKTKKFTPRRAVPSKQGLQTLVMVTQWTDATGEETSVTVIHTDLHISAATAAQLQAGWFGLQL